MKKNIFNRLIVTMAMAMGVSMGFAQGIIVKMKDGSQMKIPYEKLDCITVYEAQNVGKPLPYEATFATGMGDFKSYSTDATNTWRNQYSTAWISRYNPSTSTTSAGTDYLVSPVLSLQGKQHVHVTYEYIARYIRNASDQRLLITTTFDENAPFEGWEVLNQQHVSGADWNTFSKADILIPAKYEGKDIRLALAYTSDGRACSTWEVKNITVGQSNADSGGNNPSPEPDNKDAVKLPYTEPFSSTLGKFTNHTTSGSGMWTISYSTAKASGYDGTNKVSIAGTYYLVSPPIALNGIKHAHLVYDYVLRFNSMNDNQQVLISTTFNETNPTVGWELLNMKHAESADWQTFYKADLAIPEKYMGKTIRLAFRYNTNATTSSTWEIKNMTISEGMAVSVPQANKGTVYKRMEVPAMTTGTQLIAHWVAAPSGGEMMNYCLEYDPVQYHSRWVAFRFDELTSPTNVKRKDYSIKPQYPKDPQLQDGYIEDDYSFNNYDHGHLVASGDRLFSREANDQTFYMTNMSPQLHSFNAEYWTKFEGYVQERGRDRQFCDTLYVVKGGSIRDGEYSSRVANNRIVVPNNYYIALLKVKNNQYSAIGFWTDHNNPVGTPKDKAISIDRLEQLTGIDFFPNLPDNVENQVEAQLNLTEWKL